MSAISSSAEGVFDWSELPVLPDPVGFAAPFAGMSEGALLVAGGTNIRPDIPGESVWKGSTKIWHDRIFKLSSPTGEWSLAGKLPQPRAYGVSVTIPEGVLCVGGSNQDEPTDEVFLMRLIGDDVVTELWPALPAPLHYASGLLIGQTVYIAGGVNKPEAKPVGELLALDLEVAPAQREWRQVEPWPGKPRMLATAGSLGGELYLFSGLNLVEGDADDGLEREYLFDSWRYTPGQGWTRLADIPMALQATPSPAPTLDASHLFVLGGDDGKYLKTTPHLQDNHPGFPPAVYGYHLIRDEWAEMDQLPHDPGPDPARDPNAGIWPPIVAPVVEWQGGWAIVNGEVRPGTRTPRVLFARLKNTRPK